MIHPIGGLENPRLLTVANGCSGRAIGEARLPKESPAVQVDCVVEDSSWAVLESEDGNATGGAAYLEAAAIGISSC